MKKLQLPIQLITLSFLLGCVDVKLMVPDLQSVHNKTNAEKFSAILYDIIETELKQDAASMDTKAEALVKSYVEHGSMSLFCAKEPAKIQLDEAKNFIKGFAKEMIACKNGSSKAAITIDEANFSCAKDKSCRGGFLNPYCWF